MKQTLRTLIGILLGAAALGAHQASYGATPGVTIVNRTDEPKIAVFVDTPKSATTIRGYFKTFDTAKKLAAASKNLQTVVGVTFIDEKTAEQLEASLKEILTTLANHNAKPIDIATIEATYELDKPLKSLTTSLMVILFTPNGEMTDTYQLERNAVLVLGNTAKETYRCLKAQVNATDRTLSKAENCARMNKFMSNGNYFAAGATIPLPVQIKLAPVVHEEAEPETPPAPTLQPQPVVPAPAVAPSAAPSAGKKPAKKPAKKPKKPVKKPAKKPLKKPGKAQPAAPVLPPPPPPPVIPTSTDTGILPPPPPPPAIPTTSGDTGVLPPPPPPPVIPTTSGDTGILPPPPPPPAMPTTSGDTGVLPPPPPPPATGASAGKGDLNAEIRAQRQRAEERAAREEQRQREEAAAAEAAKKSIPEKPSADADDDVILDYLLATMNSRRKQEYDTKKAEGGKSFSLYKQGIINDFKEWGE